MATRSYIGRLKNETVKYIYCHFDGYPRHNGKLLLQNYTDPAVIDELIELGDMSSLNENIEMCSYYGRDRKEKGCDYRTAQSLSEFEKLLDYVDYLYYFSEGNWYVIGGEYKSWAMVTPRVCCCD